MQNKKGKPLFRKGDCHNEKKRKKDQS